MAVHTYRHEGTDTTRLPSASIWGRFPWASIRDGHTDGSIFFEDFVTQPVTANTTEGNWGSYATFGSTYASGTMNPGSGTGGEVILASDDDNEGASIRTVQTPFKLSQSHLLFAFEIRLKVSTIADTKFEFFAGLMENATLTATVPITATAATLADKNLVGFYRTESDGDAIATTYKADGVTAVTIAAAEIVPVADTYLKLGMLYRPFGDIKGNYRLSFYKDGTRLASSKQLPSAAGTDFPNDVGLGFVLAVRNAAGSSPGTLTCDWVRIGQVYS